MAVKVERISKSVAKSFVGSDDLGVHNVPFKIVSGAPGPLTLKQKIQNGYKAVVGFVAALLTLSTQIQFLTPFLPDQQRVWIGTGIAVLGAISTFLVKNQEFVESL